MKKVILALMTILAFSFTSSASETKNRAKHKSDMIKHHPPRTSYRVGAYHRNVPRHAVRVERHGNVHFNHNGVFFSPRGRGWVVVSPPVHRRPVAKPAVRHQRNANYRANNRVRYNNRCRR